MTDEIQRLKHEISVIEQATGVGLPFNRQDTRRSAIGGLIGLPLIIWSLVGPSEPPIAGIAIVATLIAVFLASSLTTRTAQRNQAEEPLVWREHKMSLALFAFASGAAFSYLAIGIWADLTLEFALASAIFVGAVVTAVPVILGRNRVHMLGGSVWTLAYAAVLPLANDRQLMLATGLWILLAGTTTAAVMVQQLRGAAGDASD